MGRMNKKKHMRQRSFSEQKNDLQVSATATVTAPPRRGLLEASGRRWPPSYTIVDADVAADALPEADRPRRREFPPPPPGARYDRLPAPPPYYRHGPAPHYHPYSDGPDVAYSGRRPDLDYSVTRPDVGYSAGRPDLDYPAGRPGLDYSVRRPEVDYPPRQPDLDYSGRRPDAEYSAKRPDFPFPRRPEAGGRTVLDPRHHGAVYRGPQDPYREYNPRQPAPWSLQVGARLTVRDDGRRLPLGGAGGGAGGRRFYVSSQPPGPHYAVPLRYA